MSDPARDYGLELLQRAEDEITKLAELGLADWRPDRKQFALAEILRYVNKKRYAELKSARVDFGAPP